MDDRFPVWTTSFAKLIDPAGQIKGPALTPSFTKAQQVPLEPIPPPARVPSQQVAQTRPPIQPRPRGHAYSNLARVAHEERKQVDHERVIAAPKKDALPLRPRSLERAKAETEPIRTVFDRAKAAIDLQERQRGHQRGQGRGR